METVQISSGQAAFVLTLHEDYYVEFKSIDIAPGRLSQWVSAFGNSSGGDIYVGISEPTRGMYSWAGFDRPEDSNQHAEVLQQLFPMGDDFRYLLLSAAGCPGYVLKIEVARSRKLLKASDGQIYKRVGSAKAAVRTDEERRILELQKGLVSYETETVDAPIDLASDSYQVTEFMLSIVPTSEAEPWLRKQLLIREHKPTVAALVLFADEPQIVLPKASVIVYRYATDAQFGTREVLVDGKTHLVEGSAYQQIRQAVALTKKLIEGIRDRNLESVSYPEETLHEIITNAVIHRDYSQKDNVHVRIFDDRVEIESPGRLPGHVTPKNILESRFSRNEAIERLLHKFPDAPNKNVGEGLNTAFAAMSTMRLKEPEILERDASVLVIIRHDRLDSPATMILEYLKSNRSISNREARDLTGVNRDGPMRKVFERLVEKGEIERVPGTIKGGSRYQLPSRRM